MNWFQWKLVKMSRNKSLTNMYIKCPLKPRRVLYAIWRYSGAEYKVSKQGRQLPWQYLLWWWYVNAYVRPATGHCTCGQHQVAVQLPHLVYRCCSNSPGATAHCQNVTCGCDSDCCVPSTYHWTHTHLPLSGLPRLRVILITNARVGLLRKGR